MGRRRRRSKTQPRSSSPEPPNRVSRTPRRLAIVASLGALALAIWWLTDKGEVRKRPNLILITADTLRADKLSCYGNDSIDTPHIDRLAASGVLFENAATVTPLTLPAHSSIFTGTYPAYHGVRDNGGYYLGHEQTTLAEVLEENGWATGAFVGAFVLDSRWGLDQGFDRYFDDFDFSQFKELSLSSVERRGDAVLEAALEWMSSVRGRPFFSWIHFFDPHTPYDPPEPYRTRYEESLYDGEVAFVDDLVGRLMSWVHRAGLHEETVVVFVGDHGEGLGQHGESEHGFFVYDSTMRIPFILRSPYYDLEPRRVAAQVSAIDLMPTLLDLLDLSQPSSLQGQSLRALAEGEETDPGLLAYSESYYPRNHYGWSELRSLRDGELHFISAPEPELYDVRADPLERRTWPSRGRGPSVGYSVVSRKSWPSPVRVGSSPKNRWVSILRRKNDWRRCLGAQLAISVHNCPVLADTRFPMSIFKRTQRKYVKKAYRVRNWREYESGLRNRGSLTVWISLTAGKLVNWDAPRPRRRKPGRQRKYSNHAIETAVTLGMVFHLSSRQSEGLLGSLFALMKLDNDVPDHTTLSRRKPKLGKVPFYQVKQKTPLHILIDSSGLAVHAGQLRRAQKSRDYRKLHLSVSTSRVAKSSPAS